MRLTQNKSEADPMALARHPSPRFLTNRTLVLKGMAMGPSKRITSPTPLAGTRVQWRSHVTRFWSMRSDWKFTTWNFGKATMSWSKRGLGWHTPCPFPALLPGLSGQCQTGKQPTWAMGLKVMYQSGRLGTCPLMMSLNESTSGIPFRQETWNLLLAKPLLLGTWGQRQS